MKSLLFEFGFWMSFATLYQAISLFALNLNHMLKVSEIHKVAICSATYCLIFQYGSIRWAIYNYNLELEGTDILLWKAIETFGFITIFYVLRSLKLIAKRVVDDASNI